DAPMRIVMVASECEPFAKTGGLADVVDALARALGRRGHTVDVVLPFYRGLKPPEGQLRRQTVSVQVGERPGERRDVGDQATVDLVDGQADGYRLRLVDHPFSFDRADYYVDGGTDYPDNAARFTLLARAALVGIALDGQPVDVLHGHDWEAGPALLALEASRGSQRPKALVGATGILTCHNLAYHGWTSAERTWQLGDLLPFAPAADDGVDLLRAGIGAADLVNTVSPGFARESLGTEMGSGVDDLLRALGDRYSGIVNGIDTELWDPSTDTSLPATFSRDGLAGKVVCRSDLTARHGLDADGPIFGMVGRLDPQKGFDLVTGAAERLVAAGGRLIVLGTGDHGLVSGLKALAMRLPDRIVVLDRFDRDEARRIYAGSDAFLMPSRFEPCGQGQMISLRYGTVPVVRHTGGLADTVFDADARSDGNGFVFGPADPAALLDASVRAVAAWYDRPRWAALMSRGMAIDHSWDGPAAQYEALYRRGRALRMSTTT
ncbi:MAG TPA: glycogen synthase, partial [Candidatus Saccharimonadia bacterium]|nr:glycogen synthase [Candidatus Saccharimonadia bacterium]